ncbi:MAG: nuclease-related domain-containing protein, partial [Candidatus Aenigmatarchaeota archaeon]
MMNSINHRNISKSLSGLPVEIKNMSFVERRIQQLDFEKEKHINQSVIFCGISIAIFMLGVILQSAGLCAAGMIFGGISFISILSHAFSNDTTVLEAGLSGEYALREKLRGILSDNYTVIYNYPTPYGDIDALVVGPAGVFVLEAKNHNGYITIDENGWRRQKVGQMGTVYDASIGNPEKQAKRNA